MKNILIALITLLIAGCENKNNQPPNPHRMELDNDSNYHDQNYRIYTLEGCEYVVAGAGNYQWGSHKGNCKNSLHYTK